MTPAEYSAKAIWHLELAERETDLERKSENLTLALSYMRLAELAEKNAKTDVVYETPADPGSGSPDATAATAAAAAAADRTQARYK